MKKILLSVFALVMSAVAMANDDIIVLDSMYHKNPMGDITTKYTYLYDENGNQLLEAERSPKNDLLGFTRNIYENGLLVREESYTTATVTSDGNYLMEAYSENKYVDGILSEIYTYYYEPISGEYIGDSYVKIQKMQNGIPVDLVIYEMDEDGKWSELAKQIAVLNDKGQIAKSTMTIMYEGVEMNEVNTYEYDDHGYESKMTYTMEVMGMVYMNQTTYSENEYGIYDGPIRVTHFIEEEGKAKECTYIEDRFYGNLKTGINNILAPIKKSSAVYDLLGRKTSKSFRGIAIQNGKKFIK